MKAEDTVMLERGVDYDTSCGQEMVCDILPKYVNGEQIDECYYEISNLIDKFVCSERKQQAEISFKVGIKEVVGKIKKTRLVSPNPESITQFEPFYIVAVSQLKEWGIDEY